jgi:uncharacterized membrane protein YphA (DoxX/SURF4 family)
VFGSPTALLNVGECATRTVPPRRPVVNKLAKNPRPLHSWSTAHFQKIGSGTSTQNSRPYEFDATCGRWVALSARAPQRRCLYWHLRAGLGLLLVAGYKAGPVALVLAIWCVVTRSSSTFADRNMMLHFLKNIMIAGGLLQIAHFGAVPVGVDTRSGR